MLAFLNRIIKKIKCFLYLILNSHRYKAMGNRIVINTPIRVDGHENIILHDSVRIGKYSWLASKPLTDQNSILEIYDNTLIGNFAHIYSTRKVIIESNVLIADKVYISDNSHSYENVLLPIWKQPIKQLRDVIIGENSWIGEGVCIIGSSIGKHCVIGANSVVTHDIPDYSVAVGIPAKVIKKYNVLTKEWEKK